MIGTQSNSFSGIAHPRPDANPLRHQSPVHTALNLLQVMDIIHCIDGCASSSTPPASRHRTRSMQRLHTNANQLAPLNAVYSNGRQRSKAQQQMPRIMHFLPPHGDAPARNSAASPAPFPLVPVNRLSSALSPHPYMHGSSHTIVHADRSTRRPTLFPGDIEQQQRRRAAPVDATPGGPHPPHPLNHPHTQRWSAA